MASCQRRPVRLIAILLAMAGDKHCALGIISVGQGDTGISGSSRRSSNPRHHAKGDASRLGGFELLGTATEHKGVATFKTNYPFACLGMRHQQGIDLILRYAMRSSFLANTDTLGIATHQVQYLGRNQLIVEHHLGLLDLLQPLEGQQSRIARACAYQHYLAPYLLGGAQLFIQPDTGFGFAPTLQQTQQAGGAQGSLPEAASLGDGGECRFHLATPLTGQTRQRPQMGGQQGLQTLAQQTGQHWRRPATGDGDHYGRAIYDGGEDKAGVSRIVYHIDPDLCLFGCLGHLTVNHLVIRRSNHQSLTGQMLRSKAASDGSKPLTLRQRLQFGMKLGSHHGQSGTGLQQQARLAQCHLAPTDQQDGTICDIGKQGQVLHGALLSRFTLTIRLPDLWIK